MASIIKLNKRRQAVPQPLDELFKLVETDMNEVNSTIVNRMDSPVTLIPKMAGHIVAAGGKRLRPLLTLAAAKLCGYEGKRHIKLATCVEFIHTATLLHDDVVDDSELRRGKPTANAIWGNQPSVLVGDFLFSRAFELMVEDGSLRVLEVLSKASSIIAEGEVHQLITTNNVETSEAQYLEVVQAKTAELFSAASRLGAIVTERPNIEEEALKVFGLNLGIAFQLIDDVLDYSAKQAELGKTIGDDFREGKITLPVILAFHRGNSDERKFWRNCLEDTQKTIHEDKDLSTALQLMEKHKSLSDSIHRAEHYADVARDSLGIFPNSPIKGALLGIIDFCIKRVF